MMDNVMDNKEPIGAVVKKADHVFTNLLRKTPDNGTFNRIEWQLLHFMKEKKRVPSDEVFAFLRFFDQAEAIQKLISKFQQEGLARVEREEIAITPKGEQVYEEVWKIQEEIKAKGMEGITEADYDTTLMTLQRIMMNLKEYLP